MLGQIAPVVREEQLFCVNFFFNSVDEETVSNEVSYRHSDTPVLTLHFSSLQNAPESTESIENFTSSRLKYVVVFAYANVHLGFCREMLSELFEPLDGEIKSLVSHIKSVDPLYVLTLEW